MARVTVEDCLDHVKNRFDLVLKASKRAHMLELGEADPLVPIDNDKPTVIALREIAEGFDISKSRHDLLDEQEKIDVEEKSLEEELELTLEQELAQELSKDFADAFSMDFNTAEATPVVILNPEEDPDSTVLAKTEGDDVEISLSELSDSEAESELSESQRSDQKDSDDA